VIESGVPGFDVTASYGILAPKGTSPAIVKRLNEEIGRAVATEEVRSKLLTQAMEPAPTSAQEWFDIMKTEVAKWARVIKDANITAN